MTMLFAATHPGRTRALVLYGTYARLLEAEDYPQGASREQLDKFMALVSENWGGPALAGFFAPSVADDERFRAMWARLLRAGSSPRGARELIRMYYDIDVREVLPTLAVPTLVVQRSEDRVAPVWQGRMLGRLIPDARYVELPGRDHVFFEGDADALLDEVETFSPAPTRSRSPSARCSRCSSPTS